jgi:hypothetical protein
MAVRERWIYPSDGSPPYQVPVDHVQRRPVAPAVSMGLARIRREHAAGRVGVEDHRDVQIDAARQREYRREEQKRERTRDLVSVVKGYGG